MPSTKQRWLKNLTNANIPISWDSGKSAHLFLRRKSVLLSDLPEDFLKFTDVARRIEAGHFKVYEA